MFFCHQFLRQKDKENHRSKTQKELAGRKARKAFKRLKREIKHQEAKDKALPRRERIRIMKTVPDVVQHIDREARKEKEQKESVTHTLLNRHLSVREVQKKQLQGKHATVNIRPVIKAYLALHKGQLPRHHIKNRKIALKGLREVHLSGSRKSQRKDFRHENHRRKPRRNERGQSKAPRCFEYILPTQFRRNRLKDCIKNQKKADHNGYIVVREYTESETDDVLERTLAAHQLFRTEQNQREEDNAVKPHDIPGIGCHVGGEGIKYAENRRKESVSLTVPQQIVGHCDRRERRLYDNQKRHILNHKALRKEQDKPVQGACEVVSVNRGKVDPESYVPAIEQTAAVLKLILKLRKEGRILVVEVGAKKALLPEGINAALQKQKQHGKHRHKKGKE